MRVYRIGMKIEKNEITRDLVAYQYKILEVLNVHAQMESILISEKRSIKLNHKIILNKLFSFGIHGFLNWIVLFNLSLIGSKGVTSYF